MPGLVVSVGASNMDFIFKVPYFVKPDAEMFIEELKISPGGSALNFAVNLTRLGIRTGMVSRVGKDDYGELILNQLNKEGLDTSHCIKIAKKTGMAFISVDKSGKRSIYSFPGANGKLKLNSADIDYIRSAEFIHLAGVYWELARDVARYAQKLSFSPGPLLSSHGLDKLGAVIKKSKFLFLNNEEVKILTGEDLDNGAKLILDEGVTNLIVTLGSLGSVLYNKDGTIKVPAEKIKVVDTTGAGDAFAAAFIFKWLKGKEYLKCLKFANQSARMCIGSLGAVF